MLHYQAELPHIVFLFSDTGGGHRSASEAIIEAINLEYSERYNAEMIDIFRDYAPPPLHYAPEIYPPLTRMPDVWKWWYRLSDGPRRVHFTSRMMYPYVRHSIDRLLRENPADLYVSVHPLINAPLLQALGKNRQTPYVTVVTDLVTAHAFWYHRDADMTVVCTEKARQRALAAGIDNKKLVTIGLPVADRFCHPQEDKKALRQQLGWRTDKPVVLLVGGGDGMGPLYKIARAINHAKPDLALVVVCGRNRELKTNLEKLYWQIPAYVYGFVRDMPDLMNASDILITKAGPGTITEGMISGLPIILYSRIPGQEEGNVDYVVEQHAGEWAPTPEKVVEVLNRWMANPEEYKRMGEASRSLANPQAAREIARVLISWLEKPVPDASVPRQE